MPTIDTVRKPNKTATAALRSKLAREEAALVAFNQREANNKAQLEAVEHIKALGERAVAAPMSNTVAGHNTANYAFPKEAKVGDVFYVEALHTPAWYDGTNWRNALGIVL